MIYFKYFSYVAFLLKSTIIWMQILDFVPKTIYFDVIIILEILYKSTRIRCCIVMDKATQQKVILIFS